MTQRRAQETTRGMGRYLAGVAALAALLSTVGCSPPESQDHPVDVAAERLGQAARGTSQVAGFTIAPHALSIYAGRPVEMRTIYLRDSPATSPPPIVLPSDPLTVPGTQFPIEDSVARADRLIGGCKGQATVHVWALAPHLVTTQSSCSSDGSVSHTSMVGDATLAPVKGPVDGEAIAGLWGDLEGSGIRIVRAEVDVAGDAMRVFFDAGRPDRLYQWNRGLDDVTSAVISVPSGEPAGSDIGTLTGDTVGETLDTLLEDVDEALVARIEIGPAPEGPGAHMVVKGAEWNELASAPIP